MHTLILVLVKSGIRAEQFSKYDVFVYLSRAYVSVSMIMIK